MQTSSRHNPFAGITGLLILVGIVLLGFYVIKGFLSLLWWAFPIMVIATLFIDYKVITNHFKMIGKAFQTDMLRGILYASFSFFAAPVVALWLLLKAVAKRRMASMTANFQSRMQDRFQEGLDLNQSRKVQSPEYFTEYEEIETTIRQR